MVVVTALASTKAPVASQDAAKGHDLGSNRVSDKPDGERAAKWARKKRS